MAAAVARQAAELESRRMDKEREAAESELAKKREVERVVNTNIEEEGRRVAKARAEESRAKEEAAKSAKTKAKAEEKAAKGAAKEEARKVAAEESVQTSAVGGGATTQDHNASWQYNTLKYADFI